MKKFLILGIALVLSLGMQSQNSSPVTVSGKIINHKTHEAVDFANVLLYQLKDSVYVKHTLTGSDGSYKFADMSSGRYYIKTKLLGYVEKKSKPFEVSGSSVILEELLLDEDTHVLQEAEIVGKKLFVEQQADKMVINPEASISTASDNVLDVLAKSPGVVVDKDGNISVKGKSGINILLDDKPTYLTTEQLAAMLKNLQATSVDRIEIMENPPAKYDAEGSSGVINIRTKRGKIRGYNGSVTLGTQMGKKWGGNDGLDLNYRNEKWNIYGNYYGGINNNSNYVDLTRKFPEGDGSVFKEYTNNEGKNYYTGLKLGVDYYLNKDHIIGMMGRGSGWSWKANGLSTTDIYDVSGNKQKHEDTYKHEDEGGTDWSVNLNYKWSIDTTGRSLSADVDYAYYDYGSKTDMNTIYVPASTPLTNYITQASYTNIFSAKVDYEHPFNEKTKLDAGIKSSKVTIDSDLKYEQFDYNSQEWYDLHKMSNRFKYSENINAMYASLKYKWTKKFEMQLGLRGEQTISEGNNVTIDSITKQDYTNLFPTLFLQQKFSEKHVLGLSYAYRIGRPNYWLLNPFVWMLNPYTYNKGNPLLQPQFTHSVKLSYTFDQKYILSVGYAYTKDQYTQVFEQDDETKISVIAWRNLNTVNNADVTMTIPVQATKWWQINTNLTTYYLQYKSPILETTLDRSKVTFRGNMTNTFTLPKDWSVELSGWYMSGMVYGVADFKPTGALDIGVQKLLFDKKATLKLSLSDVFDTQKQHYISNFQNIDLEGKQGYDSRRVRLTFTWRFGKDTIKPIRERSTGLEEESGRAGK